MHKPFLALVLLAFCATLLAQNTMDNAAVIKLVKAGLSDDLVISTINSQPGTYDASPDGIIALKSAGLSDKVVAAMVAKAAQGAPRVLVAPEQEVSSCSQESSVPGLPCEPGVYYKGPRGWVKLGQTSPTASATKGGGKSLIPVYGLFNHIKGVESYRGARAALQIIEPGPKFYMRLGRSNSTVAVQRSTAHDEILRLEEEKDRRDLQVLSAGVASSRSGYDEKAIREVTITNMSPEIIQIAPKSDLGPGEYLLDLGGKFDFGYHPVR